MSLVLAQQRMSKAQETPADVWREIMGWLVGEDNVVAPREVTPGFHETSRALGVVHAVMNHVWSPPWIGLYISSQSRKATLEYSQIWTRMNIMFPSEQVLLPKIPNLVGVDVANALARSSCQPLQLRLSSLDIDPCISTWAKVLAHRARCTRLELVWRPQKYLWQQGFTRRQLARWASLTHLELELDIRAGCDAPPTVDFSDVPQLRTYIERGSRDHRTQVLLPLRSLETIKLVMPFGYIGARLGPAPRLKQLTVDVTRPSGWLSNSHLGFRGFDKVPGSACWPCLEELDITNCSFLLYYAAGSPIRELAIDCSHDFNSLSSLTSLLSHAKTSLTKFTMVGHLSWTDEEIRRQLTQLINLEHLSIACHFSADQMYAMVDARMPHDLWAMGLVQFLEELVIRGVTPPWRILKVFELDLFFLGNDVSKARWEWLLHEGQDFFRLICRSLGHVWESRLPEVAAYVEPLETCSLSLFADSESRTISGVDLLMINW